MIPVVIYIDYIGKHGTQVGFFKMMKWNDYVYTADKRAKKRAFNNPTALCGCTTSRGGVGAASPHINQGRKN